MSVSATRASRALRARGNSATRSRTRSGSPASAASSISPPRPLAPGRVGVQEKLFVGIAGLIGAGKTTLCTALAKELGVPAFYEPVEDNVYLADFYQDQEKYGFAMQVWLLNARFRQHQMVIWSGDGGVQDRTIYEDSVFATMLKDAGKISERDYDTYCSLFENMSNFMKKPNLIVYLDVTAEESYERIKMRSRDCESAIPLAYLQALRDAYEVFIEDISHVIPVLRVNWSQFQTAEKMAAVIKYEWERMRIITDVTFTDWAPRTSPPSTPQRAVVVRGDGEEPELEAVVAAGDA